MLTRWENAQTERQQDPAAEVAVTIVVILQLFADLTVNLISGKTTDKCCKSSEQKNTLICDLLPKVTSEDDISHDDVEFFQSSQRPVQGRSFSHHDIIVVLHSHRALSILCHLLMSVVWRHPVLWEKALLPGVSLDLDLVLWLREVSHEPEDDPPDCQRGLVVTQHKLSE